MELMTNEVVVDALPYIDSEYDEQGMKEMVQAMIEEEKKRYRPTKNYLEHLPKLQLAMFETEVMQKEFERLGQRQPMETLSMKRYELPPPPTGKLTDLQAWTECVENSYAQLEHQNTRICNLELMQEYSCESWKSYLQLLGNMVQQSQKNLQDIKRRIQEVNWQRKCKQTEAGEELKRLEDSWVGLVSKNYEIEKACMALESRLQTMQKAAETLPPVEAVVEETAAEEAVPEESAVVEPAQVNGDNGQDNEDSDSERPPYSPDYNYIHDNILPRVDFDDDEENNSRSHSSPEDQNSNSNSNSNSSDSTSRPYKFISDGEEMDRVYERSREDDEEDMEQDNADDEEEENERDRAE